MMDPEEIATNIVDAALRVHRALGRGLLESAYQQYLAYELNQRGLQVECEVALPIRVVLNFPEPSWRQARNDTKPSRP
jgi:GxxExxY protein